MSEVSLMSSMDKAMDFINFKQIERTKIEGYHEPANDKGRWYGRLYITHVNGKKLKEKKLVCDMPDDWKNAIYFDMTENNQKFGTVYVSDAYTVSYDQDIKINMNHLAEPIPFDILPDASAIATVAYGAVYYGRDYMNGEMVIPVDTLRRAGFDVKFSVYELIRDGKGRDI